MAKTIAIQRAYHAKDRGLGHAELVQSEAERLALNNGNASEAQRRRNAGIDLAKKRRVIALTPVPHWIKRDLGESDSIRNLLERREISAAQAHTVLSLRLHEQGGQVLVAGREPIGYVQGGGIGGPEASYLARHSGRMAWDSAQNACDRLMWRGVRAIILGRLSLTNVAKMVASDNSIGRARVKVELIRSIDAAYAVLG